MEAWAEIEKACEAIGRDPKTIELSMFGAQPTAEALDKLEEQGFKRAIFALPQGDRNEVMTAVEKLAEFNER